MLIRWFFLTLISAIVISCQEEIPKKHDSSLIEKEKIDAAFGNDVSQVLFDHLYVVVDSLTYSELTRNSEWKNKYVSLDLGLPDFVRDIDGSSTCYLRGHHHYIEILGPENAYNEPVGKSGIGFSLQNGGEHFHLGIAPKLKTKKSSFLNATETVSMPVGSGQQTWFKAFYTPSPGTALHTWYAFYNPIFLDSLHDRKHTIYTREAFLKDAYKEDRLFNGISSIDLICTIPDYNRIAQEMRHLECRLIEKNGARLTIESGDVSITLTPSNDVEYSRITSLRCHLNAADSSVTQLGHLSITNRGKESVWEFGELYKE